MSSPSDFCPSRTIISNCVLGLLNDDQTRETLSHIEQCAECQSIVRLAESRSGIQLTDVVPATKTAMSKHGVPSENALTFVACLDQNQPDLEPTIDVPDKDHSKVDPSLMDTKTVGDFLSDTADGLDSDSQEIVVPAKLGRFEIISTIGRGGMGAVLKARDPNLNRAVAIKLPLRISSKQARSRFEREARAAASLKHPHICAIHEVAEFNGRPFIVLEFVEGEDLEKWARHNATPRESAEMVEKIARALHYAHQHGVVHRDIKPANVLVDGETGEPILTDFGLAKISEPNESLLTHPDQVLGTPAYMSPEQALGNNDQVGASTDVYALGATLYRLLSGHVPFRGTPVEVVRKLSDETLLPDPLSSDIHRDLKTIVAKAMAWRIEDRYESASAMADDLQRFSRGEPILASRLSPWKLLARRANRHRFAVAMTIVALTIGMIGFRFMNRSIFANQQIADLVAIGASGIQSVDLNAESWNAVEQTAKQLADLGEHQKSQALHSQLASTLIRQVESDLASQTELTPENAERYADATNWLREQSREEAARLQQLVQARVSNWRTIYQWTSSDKIADNLNQQSNAFDVVEGAIQAKKEATLNLVQTTPDEANLRLKATFNAAQNNACEYGFQITDSEQRKYQFVVQVRSVRSETSGLITNISYLQIRRDDEILHESLLNASSFASEDGVVLFAEINGYELSLQLNNKEPLRVRDYFRLPNGNHKVAMLAHKAAPISKIQIASQSLPQNPSRLQMGDIAFAQKRYDDAAEIYISVTPESDPELYPQSLYKAAKCDQLRGREDDAIKKYEKLFHQESDSEFAAAAGCFLWRQHTLDGNIDQADQVFDLLELSKHSHNISSILTHSERYRISNEFGKDAMGLQLYFMDKEKVARLERRINFGDILQVRYERSTLDMRYLLLRAYLMIESDEQALRLANELYGTNWDSGVRLAEQTAAEVSWLLRMLNQPTEAEQWLRKYDGKRGRSMPDTICEHARILVAQQKPEEALELLSDLVSNTKFPKRYRYHSHAWAMKGFLEFDAGDRAAAMKSWQTGTVAGFAQTSLERATLPEQFTGQESLYALMLESLTCEGKLERAEKLCVLLAKNKPAAGFLSQGVTGHLASKLGPSVVRFSNTADGIAVIRRVVFQQTRFREALFEPLEWLGTDYISQAIKNSNCSPGELEFLKQVVKDALFAYGRKKLDGKALATLLMVWKQPVLASWTLEPALSSLPDSIRSGLAYVFALRFQHLGQPDLAKTYFQWAIDDTASDQQLKDFALQRLKE